jgi:glycine cleavage system H protein
MTAGILSYQLCELEYDCDHCPLDAALRTRFAERTQPSAGIPHSEAAIVRRQDLQSECHYSRKHTWVKMLAPTEARVGIEPGLASAVLSPKAVVLPSIGEHVQASKACAWIVMEGGTLPILAPVDGRVEATNAKLFDNPHMLCSAPLDRGWLFTLSTDRESLQQAKLLGVAEAAKAYGEDESRFRSLIMAELSKGGSTAGPTLPDGGQLHQTVSAMVGAVKYFRLVREAFT